MKKITFKRLILIVSGLLLFTVIATVLALIPWGVRSAAAIPSGDPEERAAETESAPLTEKGRLTVLLAGTDRTSGLSDVLMLLTLDRDSGEAWVLQLPRDTYVNCGSGNYRKLNGAPAALGGMREFRDFMAESLGIPIHRYVRLSPDAFRQMVDAVGGVEIDLVEP